MADVGGNFSRLNHSKLNATSQSDHVDPSARLFFILGYSLVFLVGLLLNGFTLKVYFCSSQRQVPSCVTVYLKNLVAADFLISLCLPLRISHYASSSVSLFRVYCNFGASAFYLNMYASILFMGYIAANRYLKIVHPLGTHVLQTLRAAHVVSTLTWLLLLAMMATYVTLSLLTQDAQLSVSTVSCDALHSKKLSVFYKVIHSCMAVIFILVLVSLIFFYYSTSRRLAVAQQRQPASSSRKLVKSRRNMLVLVCVFCVCFVPYHLVRLPYAFLRGRSSLSQAFFYLKEVTVMLSVLNVCLDPLLYFIFCKAFRAQLRLGKVLGSESDPTLRAKAEGRSSEGRNSTINRKTSLSTVKMIGVQ